jgi:hypothetical protein
MRKIKTQQSRRALLKKGSLGVAGTLGAAGVASVGASLLNETRASAASAHDLNDLVGVWEIKANLKGTNPFPIPLPPEINLVHGQITFFSGGILIATTDLEEISSFKGPLIMGNWKATSSNHFAIFAKRRFLNFAGVDAGVVEIQGTGELDASGNNLTATLTLKLSPINNLLPSLTITYTVQGTPLPKPTS